jgi:hypothetical protein
VKRDPSIGIVAGPMKHFEFSKGDLKDGIDQWNRWFKGLQSMSPQRAERLAAGQCMK